MRTLILFTILALGLAFSGCQKEPTDPCDNITCLNGGSCVNGTCECPTGYEGADCRLLKTPSSMTIESVVLTDYPTTTSTGASWDVNDGADLFISLNTGNTATQNEYTSNYYSNVTGQSLTYTTGLPVTLTNINGNYTIALWDYDATSNDDLMTGGVFSPADNMNNFPRFVDLTGQGFSVTLVVKWNF